MHGSQPPNRHIWAASVGGCPEHCLHPQDANGTLLPKCGNQKCVPHRHTSPGGPPALLKTSALKHSLIPPTVSPLPSPGRHSACCSHWLPVNHSPPKAMLKLQGTMSYSFPLSLRPPPPRVLHNPPSTGSAGITSSSPRFDYFSGVDVPREQELRPSSSAGSPR